jgi:hypothetical protein
MRATMKLDHGTMHLLRLAAKDANADGWSKVSSVVWPVVQKVPDDLLEKEFIEGNHYCRLTERGETVLYYS